MAEAFVSEILKQLASITLQQAEQEVRLVVGVEKEVEKLTSNLQTIQAVLEDAERRQVKEAAVKQWLAKLKEASYDMDDVLDEWNTAILKMQIEGDANAPQPKGKVCSFIPSCFCYRQVALRRDIAIKIKQLNERLDVIANEKRNFDFTLMRGNEELERQMTASVIDVSMVHGRDEDKNTVVNMLLSESSQGPPLRIISIVGMGGLGKTTLAQLVYNDDTVKAHFQEKIWVCVSDPFDEIRIAKAILESLKDDDRNLNELDSLLRAIHRSIEGKKFLLILDDVWNEDSRKWELLKNSLISSSPGSRILITTRKENVAIIMGTTNKFPLGQLSNEKCWTLLSQVAFSERNKEECEKFEDIGKKIVDKCKGLPLAAKTLGGLLRFKNTREEWQSVLNSEVWKLEEVEKGLFPPLLLSYYDLSSTMRRCFSYCAIFPKDYMLEKDELIKLWMAQGYLKATTCGKDMEMVGEECFKNLTMRSFFQDFKRDENGSIISCKMHDIVHDFAQFLTENECFVMEVHDSEELMSSHVKARHSMLMLARGVSIPTSIKNVKNLHSLIIEWQSEDVPMTSAALSKIFDQLTRLRTLNLNNKPIIRKFSLTKVPKEIGKLIHLRYLNLAANSKLKELPETVCDLCNLQSLNVKGCLELEKLPLGLGKLINLMHLENFETGLSWMPKGIGRLSCLRTLDNFYVSSGVNDSEASTLKDLEKLNHLRGCLKIYGLGNVRDVDDVKKAQLKNKKHLVKLLLDFNEEEEEEAKEGRRRNDEQVIEAMQPPLTLEELEIKWYRGRNVFPNWMTSLTNLKNVVISACTNCEVLPLLGKLLSLESLCIINMAGVKKVGIELLGIESEVNKNEGSSNTSSSISLIAFPKLKELSFDGMENWEEWEDYGMRRRMGEEDITTATTNITIMPRLHSLTIKWCPKLKALPHHLLHECPSLKELQIFFSRILSERYHNGWRKGEEWPNISHIPNILINYRGVQGDCK